MKITDPDVIKNGEKGLIEAVKDDLDMAAVKEILKKRMGAAQLSSKGGEIIVHNNEIAYRLDFDIHISGSLMFDRQGNYISDSEESGEPDESGTSEDIISEDLDLEDININETLEEVAPQTLLNDEDTPPSEDTDTPVEDDLNIDLPDYDDDELNPEDGDVETQQALEDENNEIAADKTEQIADETEPEEDDLIQDDIVDDDISDILQESQDFWEQKKDS